MEAPLIITEFPDPSIGVITLNRPQAANALNQALAEALAAALQSLVDHPAVRVLILTGAGGRAFCAGADLKERQGMNVSQWQRQHAAFERARDAVLHCPKPIIAAVNGAAMGGGMELALACDFIYAAASATFGLTEASLGIMPGMGGTQTLPRAIGSRRAKEFLFLAQPFSAQTAYDTGMVNRLCEPDALLPTTLEIACIIAANAPRSLRAIKQSVDQGHEQPLPQALHTELDYYHELIDSPDRLEGMRAWAEKRKPHFTGM